MEKENNLIVEIDAEKEALKLYELFLPYVNDEQDRICDLVEVDTQKANAKKCALIALAGKMKTAMLYKHCSGSITDCANLLRIKAAIEKI